MSKVFVAFVASVICVALLALLGYGMNYAFIFGTELLPPMYSRVLFVAAWIFLGLPILISGLLISAIIVVTPTD